MRQQHNRPEDEFPKTNNLRACGWCAFQAVCWPAGVTMDRETQRRVMEMERQLEEAQDRASSERLRADRAEERYHRARGDLEQANADLATATSLLKTEREEADRLRAALHGHLEGEATRVPGTDEHDAAMARWLERRPRNQPARGGAVRLKPKKTTPA